MQLYFTEPSEKALQFYRDHINTPLVSSMPETVIEACYYGKVDTLFVQEGLHLWGKFDRQDCTFDWHPVQSAQSEDLVAFAIRQALATGGQILEMPPDGMPWNEARIAAIMRY